MADSGYSVDLFGNPVVGKKLIDRAILEKALMDTLRGVDADTLVSMMYSKYEAIIDFARLCNGDKTGEKISMLFNPHRYNTATHNSASIIAGFKKDSFLSGLARATLFKESKVKELLYQVLQLGINGVQYVNEFPPIISQKFCELFGARSILDPCAGWGGRMIGAASIGAFYHGFEPCTKTFDGLVSLGCFLKLFDTGFDFVVENTPFEDCALSAEYDLALTSPPYYDTELYSDEPTNSCNRYNTFTEWENGFYIPMIEKTVKHSKYFIINVGTRRYDLKSVLFERFNNTKEIESALSGAVGLGREESGKERFYLLKGMIQ